MPTLCIPVGDGLLNYGEHQLALEGYLDICAENLVAGWVWDKDRPETRIVVEIFIDGELLASVAADQYREDLRSSGIGDGAHAFHYVHPSPFEPNRQTVHVAALGTNVWLPRSQTQYIVRHGHSPLNWPPMAIDVEAVAPQLDMLHGQIRSAWLRLGRTEPHWSVLTDSKFKANIVSQHDDLFFQTGRQNVEDFCAFLLRSGLLVSKNQTCFELGCGVGRLTVWLAAIFTHVFAADISNEHLKIAEESFKSRCIKNVSLIQLTSIRDLDSVEEFDVFFSVIVFQHNPPPIIAYMLRIILSKLKAGGIGYFQIPTYSKHYSFNLETYLSRNGQTQGMEMHVLPQAHIIGIIYSCGCKLLEIREDGWTGDVNGVSNTFLIQKTP